MCVGKKEDLQLVGIGDASYKSDEKAIEGVLLLLTNKEFTRASPLYWRSKQFERVCHS